MTNAPTVNWQIPGLPEFHDVTGIPPIIVIIPIGKSLRKRALMFVGYKYYKLRKPYLEFLPWCSKMSETISKRRLTISND